MNNGSHENDQYVPVVGNWFQCFYLYIVGSQMNQQKYQSVTMEMKFIVNEI